MSENEPKRRQRFDPTPYLIATQRNGPKNYLPVAWALVALHHDFDGTEIKVEQTQDNQEYVEYKTSVRAVDKDTGKYRYAEAFGSGKVGSFQGGYKEKAETRSLGRALRKIGIGAQYAGDELDETDPSDSATTGRSTTPSKPQPVPSQGQGASMGGNGPQRSNEGPQTAPTVVPADIDDGQKAWIDQQVMDCQTKDELKEVQDVINTMVREKQLSPATANYALGEIKKHRAELSR